MTEADGTQRIVDYTADKHNGFNAVVTKVGEPKQQLEHGSSIGGGHHWGF